MEHVLARSLSDHLRRLNMLQTYWAGQIFLLQICSLDERHVIFEVLNIVVLGLLLSPSLISSSPFNYYVNYGDCDENENKGGNAD